MSECEVCLGRAERACGYDDQPMLGFCTEDYIEHLETAHQSNDTAQHEARQLRASLKKSERGLLRMGKTEPNYYRHPVGLTRPEQAHLLHLLIKERDSGDYYGDKQRHHARRDRLIALLDGDGDTQDTSAGRGDSEATPPQSGVSH